MSSRLVVVSNRLVIPHANWRLAAGGLAVALHGALKRQGGVWLGWSGEVSEEEPRSDDMPPVSEHRKGNVTYVTFDLTRRDYDQYYAGFSNRTLWPLLHYRPGLTEFARADLDGYQRVNRLFARTLLAMLKPDDIVWVHDYHLIPLAAELRKLGVKNRIGFFLHVPWPAADLFVVLPNHDELSASLAAYDLVGLQTADDVANLLAYYTREAKGIVGPHGAVQACGRSFRVQAFPVGIDTEEFARFAQRPASASVERLVKSLGGRKLVLGVDRLDYSKGIGARIAAIGRMLELSPEQRGRFTFLQIAPRSRETIAEYAALYREVAELSGRINATFGDIDWQPIHYINRSIARTTLAGFYRAARVCLVTSLRDGMNLVAKEFVAAQDGEDPGVLVLSRFAGAARELTDALIVNPYDTDGMAHALDLALRMGKEERRARWSRMFEHLSRATVDNWCSSFLAALGGDHHDVDLNRVEVVDHARTFGPRRAVGPVTAAPSHAKCGLARLQSVK